MEIIEVTGITAPASGEPNETPAAMAHDASPSETPLGDDPLVRLPDTPPRRTVLAVSAARVHGDKETVAVFCAREIRAQARAYARIATPPHVRLPPAEGGGDGDPATDDTPLNAIELHRAAVGLHLELIYRMERGKGYGSGSGTATGNPAPDESAVYVPDEDGDESGAVIYLSRHVPKRKQRAQIVHEMGHHLQRTRVARAVYDADVVTCADLDGAAIRHEIARRVEALVAQTG